MDLDIDDFQNDRSFDPSELSDGMRKLKYANMQFQSLRMRELAKMYHAGFFGDLTWKEITRKYLKILPRKRKIVIRNAFGKRSRRRRSKSNKRRTTRMRKKHRPVSRKRRKKKRYA